VANPGRQERRQPQESPTVEEAIRVRAYELFEERGHENGHDQEDWLRAEEEITGKKIRTMAA
jgi:hypothetical protein